MSARTDEGVTCLRICDEMHAWFLSFLALEQQCVCNWSDIRSDLSSPAFHTSFRMSLSFCDESFFCSKTSMVLKEGYYMLRLGCSK